MQVFLPKWQKPKKIQMKGEFGPNVQGACPKHELHKCLGHTAVLSRRHTFPRRTLSKFGVAP